MLIKDSPTGRFCVDPDRDVGLDVDCPVLNDAVVAAVVSCNEK